MFSCGSLSQGIAPYLIPTPGEFQSGPTNYEDPQKGLHSTLGVLRNNLTQDTAKAIRNDNRFGEIGNWFCLPSKIPDPKFKTSEGYYARFYWIIRIPIRYQRPKREGEIG